MTILETPPIPIIGVPRPNFISDLENPPGCIKLEAKALVRGPFSDCNIATVQIVTKNATGTIQYNWDGTTFTSDSTRNVFGAINSNYVAVQDSSGQVAYAFYEIKPYPPVRILFDKINGCNGAPGSILIKRLLNGFLFKAYTYALTQNYDAITETVLNDVPVTSGGFVNGVTATLNNLTIGNYRLTVTDPDTNCTWQVRFTICDNCGESSADNPDQTGGCGCACDDCTDDTTVNVTGLGN